MQQLSMFDIWSPPPALLIGRVDPYGPVIQGPADETLSLPRKGNANPIAEIELHQHTDGRWMWSVHRNLSDGSGGGYKIGPKWGKFAETRAGALRGAVDELVGCLTREDLREVPSVIAWARALA